MEPSRALYRSAWKGIVSKTKRAEGIADSGITMPKYDNVVGYFGEDFPRTLFPLDTKKVLVDHAAEDLGEFIYENVTHESDSDSHFLPQVRAYAAKPDSHLRRSLVLDPIAEFFMYDITYRHRTALRSRKSERRKSFGYEFRNGRMLSSARSYRQFRTAVNKAMTLYAYCAKLDIAQYFNSLYHHDIVAWFRDYAKTNEDAEIFGKFLRQINAGRSIDCLPHGIYPAKMIGSHFLGFLESSTRLNASLLLRFMDDIYLFDNDERVVQQDFYQIQRMLGERSLCLNSAKTRLGKIQELDIKREVDEVKKRLLERRGWIILASGASEEVLRDAPETLNTAEVEYLYALLRDEAIEEEDADLVLSLLREDSDDVLEHIPRFLERFPSLIKNLFHFAHHVSDKSALLGVFKSFLSDFDVPTEYQLFWLAKIVETELLDTQGVGDVLALLYEHPRGSKISRAKVLEIPEKRFDMPDLREEELRTGASGWLAWSAAVGSRKVRKANRNHLLSYFANGSPINRLIANCIKGI